MRVADRAAAVQGCRHQRATGAALSVATALLEACAHGDGGHVLLLAGGPCTVGPGQIVSQDYAEPLRTHKDLAKGTAKFFAPSAEFYDRMAHRLIENGQALDVFASCLDQVPPPSPPSLACCPRPCIPHNLPPSTQHCPRAPTGVAFGLQPLSRRRTPQPLSPFHVCGQCTRPHAYDPAPCLLNPVHGRPGLAWELGGRLLARAGRAFRRSVGRLRFPVR